MIHTLGSGCADRGEQHPRGSRIRPVNSPRPGNEVGTVTFGKLRRARLTVATDTAAALAMSLIVVRLSAKAD